MKNLFQLPQIARILIGGAAIVISAILSWILEYFIGNVAMLMILLGGAVFATLNPELMDGE